MVVPELTFPCFTVCITLSLPPFLSAQSWYIAWHPCPPFPLTYPKIELAKVTKVMVASRANLQSHPPFTVPTVTAWHSAHSFSLIIFFISSLRRPQFHLSTHQPPDPGRSTSGFRLTGCPTTCTTSSTFQAKRYRYGEHSVTTESYAA